MEKIEKYIKKFFMKHEKNVRYDIRSNEMVLLSELMQKDRFRAISDIFNYGYAKGYRAAMAEMKKGGAV